MRPAPEKIRYLRTCSAKKEKFGPWEFGHALGPSLTLNYFPTLVAIANTSTVG